MSKFGAILKRETLSNAPLPFKSKYLVLHLSDPFPGYYCSEANPTDNSCKEFSFYIPFKNNYFGDEELLCRISLEIQAELSIKICPSVTVSRPLSALSKVLLPEPLGPMITTTSPRSIWLETFLSASSEPNFFVTFSIRIIGSLIVTIILIK